MSNFKIEIQGLAELKASFESDVTQKAIPDISVAILKYNNVLGQRVNEVFTVPGKLEQVRKGRSVKPERVGKYLIQHSLEYVDKPIELHKFPYTVSNSNALSKAPLRRVPLGRVTWKEGKWSKEVKVSIVRGKSKIAKRGKNYRLKGFEHNGRILARKQKATWLVKPSLNIEGTRAPVSQLFGPSLATLAKVIYTKDAIALRAEDKMTNDIIDAIVKAYDS